MTIPNRTVSIKSVFASTANTTIPTPPATGVSYRNTGTTAAEIGEGWPFKEVVDSAKFNQAMYEYTTICQQLEKYGFLPWSANTDYPAQGCALGSDGKIYQAKQATGPSSTSIDPTTDTSHIYWDLFYYADVTADRALVSNADGKVAASSVTATELGYLSGVTSSIQTQINNRAADNAVVHTSGNETISGTKTFSSTISGSINGNAATVTNGVYTSGDQTISGTKTFSSSPVIPTPISTDNSTKATTTAFVKTAIGALLSNLYPIGSIYIGTQSTCPLATLISGSTWAKIGTSITTDVTIPSSIAVYGNGKTLGLTLNNSSNYGLSFGTNNSWGLRLNTGFGSNINSSVSETSIPVNKALGITNKTNGDSGIVAKSDSITKTSITVNIWQRIA
jgi:hypothetical protein